MYGREAKDRQYQGVNTYNDAGSSLIWTNNQASLGINETGM